jgi:hypothetical protein
VSFLILLIPSVKVFLCWRPPLPELSLKAGASRRTGDDKKPRTGGTFSDDLAWGRTGSTYTDYSSVRALEVDLERRIIE